LIVAILLWLDRHLLPTIPPAAIEAATVCIVLGLWRLVCHLRRTIPPKAATVGSVWRLRRLIRHLRRTITSAAVEAAPEISVAATIGRRLDGGLRRGRLWRGGLRRGRGWRGGAAAIIAMVATIMAAALILLVMATIAAISRRIGPGNRRAQKRNGCSGDQIFFHGVLPEFCRICNHR
jgi:hypothetical protein